MKENWKSHPRYRGIYEISDKGRVRSIKRTVVFSDGRERLYKGQLLKQYEDDFGYKKVTLKENCKDERAHVHKLVAETFIGKRPKKYLIRHLNGNRRDNKPINLRYGSCRENHADMALHGTKLFGENHASTSLREKDVAFIMEQRGKMTGRALAKKFKVSPVTICSIQKGKRWVHFKREACST